MNLMRPLLIGLAFGLTAALASAGFAQEGGKQEKKEKEQSGTKDTSKKEAAAKAEEPKKLVIAVKDLEAKGIAKSETSMIAEQICVEVAGLGRFDTSCAHDEQAILDHQGEREMLGIETQGDTPKARKQADRIITGDMGRVGKTLILNLSYQDARTGVVLGRKSVKIDGSADKLLPQLKSIVTELVR